MNDPNGLIQWKGQFHLFYQHNPFGALWGNIHWGHAISEDFIHWTDAPIALAPTPGSYDESGIFSGCTVNNAGVPTIVYTATRGESCEIQVQAIATGSDDLLSWQKSAYNPVLSRVPPEAGQTRDFRDPFVWKEGDGWYLLLGSRIQNVGGAAFLYRSADLLQWEYLHPLLVGDMRQSGDFWECPNFFPLGDRWVLVVSAHTHPAIDAALYFVGDYQDHVFTPHFQGVLDYGCLYAPLSMVDEQDRRILISWIRETRSDADIMRAGWAGVQSIPRVLTLDDQHRLNMTPIPELSKIRGRHHHYPARAPGGIEELDINGLAFDIEASFTPEQDSVCGLSITFSEDGGEKLDIGWDAARQTLFVRPTINQCATQVREAPHTLRLGDSLRLRILLDGSVVEIIANDHTSLTHRVYPSQAKRSQLNVFGEHVQSLDIWEMQSIW